MSGKRIGERLSHLIPLSGHDIEEILSEQGATGRRFGDIALRMGLCTPEHIWSAFRDQLAESPQRVNLNEFGIDAQAIERLPASVALRYHVVPVRAFNDELVIAVNEAAYPEVAHQLTALLGTRVSFVLCSHYDIAKALRSYYLKATAA
jgi:hypothetical protein